ncbi:restriction endonuclease subunit S [Enterococcus sp. LJL98]
MQIFFSFLSFFSHAWEQRKLKDECHISAGGDVNKDKLKSNGKYPVIANALTNDGIMGYYEDDFRIESPAVTVTGRGDVGFAKARKIHFTPVVRLLSVKSDHNVDFLEHSINNHATLVESTGVPQLTAPQLGNYKIYFPTINEQTKIGSFFQQLDETITLQECKSNTR